MDKENQKFSVRIGGMSYNLVSSEPEPYIRQIAARADEMIRRVAMSSPKLSQQMTVILALTNAVDELTRQAQQQSLAEHQRDTAELKVTELRTELAKSRELNWEMKKELLRLNTLCHQQEEQLKIWEKQEPAKVPSAKPVTELRTEPEANIEPETTTEPETSDERDETIESEVKIELETSIEPEPATYPEDAAYCEEDGYTGGGEYPEMKKATVLHPGTIPVLSGRRPLKTIGELRQTGLDEYLSLFDLPKSRELEIHKEDES